MKKKAKKETKNSFKYPKIWIIASIFAFMVFAFLITYTAVTKDTGTITGHAGNSVIVGNNFITKWFQGFKGDDVDLAVSKTLYAVIVVLLIFSILSFVGFPPQRSIAFLIALIVGFLATAYITPGEIFVILTTYSALGLILGTIIPFFILLMASVAIFTGGRRASSPGTAMLTMRIFINLLMWIGFEVFLVYKFISFWDIIKTEAKTFAIIFIVLIALSAFVILFHRYFIKFIVHMKITAIGLSASEQQQLANINARP